MLAGNGERGGLVRIGKRMQPARAGISIGSPAGLAEISMMGLDITSSNSSRAGEIAWEGIR